MSETEVTIRPVEDADAGELLTLRRAGFVTEAQQYDDPHIPPLTQTLDELRADIATEGVVTLGAWAGHRLVGSIRVVLEGRKATLGRFVVAPDQQGHGIGTQLLLAILRTCPRPSTRSGCSPDGTPCRTSRCTRSTGTPTSTTGRWGT
jgi:GNAT superfamily N-acetyltransferase